MQNMKVCAEAGPQGLRAFHALAPTVMRPPVANRVGRCDPPAHGRLPVAQRRDGGAKVSGEAERDRELVASLAAGEREALAEL